MSISKFPDFSAFLSTYISETDGENDLGSVQAFVSSVSAEKHAQVLTQAKAFAGSASLTEDLGMTANRWFGDADEAKEWMETIIQALSSASAEGSVVVKDSNGAVLEEGDAVTVIKDLKVKGGSSDLKRGTLIKKIHLIGDPGNIECNVDGSTLVLKTIFLKKASS